MRARRDELVAPTLGELTLERLGGLRRDVQLAGDRVGELAPAGTEHADEARDAAFVHGDRSDAATEGHDAFAARRVAAVRVGVRQGTDQCERKEVDGGDAEAGGLDRGDEARGRRFVRGDEQHLHQGFAVFARRVPEDGEVEHGFVHRDRDEVGGLVLQCTGELVTRHRRHLDLPNDRTGARETEAHRRLLEVDLRAETRDRVDERTVVDDLALAHRVGRQCDLSEAFEARRIPWRDLGKRDRVGPDVKADQAAGHCPPPGTVVCASR